LTYFDIPWYLEIVDSCCKNFWWWTYPDSSYGENFKLLGGGSQANGMAYFRGIPYDFDRLVNVGLKNWDWNTVFPVYKNLENNTISYLQNDTIYHGPNGPIGVTNNDQNWNSEWNTFLTKTAIQAGYQYNPDHNGVNRSGVGPGQHNIKNGRRSTSVADILAPALSKYSSYLTVKTSAMVTKLLFEEKTKIVTGVNYIENGKTQIAKAKYEVIISGGALNSPQLLMVSGIGNQTYLKSQGIPVIHDLPGVGVNLRDHHTSYMTWEYNGPLPNLFGNDVEQLQLYQTNKTGLLACAPAFEELFFSTSQYLNQNVPNIQIQTWPISDQYYIDVASLYPEANGILTIGAEPFLTAPNIDDFSYSDNDYNILVEAIKKVRNIVKYEPLKSYLGAETNPGPTPDGQDEDAFLRSWLIDNSWGYTHWVGSTKMGNDTDPLAVLDSFLKVRGIPNLRVCDAGSYPFTLNANIHVSVLMLAQRCADFILSQF